MRNIKNRIKKLLQDRINNKNIARLQNQRLTLICSNCAGGFLYHWLGLQFRSPFMNMYMTNDDFLKALENWDDFINADMKEVVDSRFNYPIGVQWGGETPLYALH